MMGKIFGSDSPTSPADSPNSQEACKKLKTAVFRGTIDNELGHGGSDCDAVEEVTKILKENPELVTVAVTLIKARIKDKAVAIVCTSIDFLDQCMQTNDFEFIQFSMVKVLGRVLKLAIPNKGTHPRIQRKASDAIRVWGATYGSDERLDQFAKASEQLSKLEAASGGPGGRRSSTIFSPLPAQGGRRSSTVDAAGPHSPLPANGSARRSSAPDLSHMSTAEVARLAKQSQQAIMAQINATKDKNVIRELRALHDQLSEDLAVYYGNQQPGRE